MKYESLLKNVKIALNVMYAIKNESSMSVIDKKQYVPLSQCSYSTLGHNVTIDKSFTMGTEIKIEICDDEIRFFKVILNNDNIAICYQYLYCVKTRNKCIAEIIAEISVIMRYTIQHYC